MWKHDATPGPWVWVNTSLTGYMDSDGDYLVAGAELVPDDVEGAGYYWDTEEAKALFTPAPSGASAEDSCLVAAAPLLFDALAELVRAERTESDGVKVLAAVHKAEAALLDAGGRET